MSPLAPAAAVLLLFLFGCAASPGADPPPQLARIALAPSDREGTARGFPEMRTLEGATLAKGEFAQSDDGNELRLRVRYQYAADHFTEEEATILQEPALVQETWSWRETRGGVLQRRFEIDFR